MANWENKFKANLLEVLYRPDQPRDEKGRWTSGGVGGPVGDDSTSLSEVQLVDKYNAMLGPDHPGIKFVDRLPFDHETGTVVYGRANIHTGEIEISRQTPPDELEVTVAHEVGHELLQPLTNKTPGFTTIIHESDGSVSVEISDNAPVEQQAVLEFWQSVHNSGGVSEYGDSFRSSEGTWNENRDLLMENLSEAFAAVQVGGRFLQEANTRNARAMQTAKELFDMIGVSK